MHAELACNMIAGAHWCPYVIMYVMWYAANNDAASVHRPATTVTNVEFK